VLQTLLAREHRCQTTTVLNANSLRQLTQNYWSDTTRHTLATVISDRTTAALTMPRLTLVASMARRKSTGTSDMEHLPVVKRVFHQNQRIEEYVMPRPQTLLLRRSAPPTGESAVFEAPVLAQSRPAGMKASWSATMPQPGFNINQITDEVVRRLDSRLVAARERFGKI